MTYHNGSNYLESAKKSLYIISQTIEISTSEWNDTSETKGREKIGELLRQDVKYHNGLNYLESAKKSILCDFTNNLDLNTKMK